MEPSNAFQPGWINELLVPGNTRMSCLLVALRSYRTSQETSQSKKEKGT